MALPQQNRLKSSRDFGRVYRRGKRASTNHLAIRALRRIEVSKRTEVSKSIDASTSLEISTKGKPIKAKSIASNRSAGEHSPALSACFGISISKKVSKRAVVRNRIKRQLQAIIYDWLSLISPGWQIVIVVRPSAVECEFTDFLRELEYLLKKLNVLSTPIKQLGTKHIKTKSIEKA